MSASLSVPWYSLLGAAALGTGPKKPKKPEQPKEPPRPFIIGVSGRAGSGKDTFAQFITKNLRRDNIHVVKYSFADPLKEAAKDLFNLSDGDVYTQEGKRLDNPFWGVRLGAKWDSNRKILQRFGTEVVRHGIADEFWLHRAEAFTQSVNGVVIIPDVRFENEAAWILKQGGVIYRMVNTNQPIVPSGKWHRRLLRVWNAVRFKPAPPWLHPSEDPLPRHLVTTELRCPSVRHVEDCADVQATLIKVAGQL